MTAILNILADKGTPLVNLNIAVNDLNNCFQGFIQVPVHLVEAERSFWTGSFLSVSEAFNYARLLKRLCKGQELHMGIGGYTPDKEPSDYGWRRAEVAVSYACEQNVSCVINMNTCIDRSVNAQVSSVFKYISESTIHQDMVALLYILIYPEYELEPYFRLKYINFLIKKLGGERVLSGRDIPIDVVTNRDRFRYIREVHGCATSIARVTGLFRQSVGTSLKKSNVHDERLLAQSINDLLCLFEFS